MLVLGLGPMEITLVVVLLILLAIMGIILYSIWCYYNARARVVEERLALLEKRLDEKKKGQ